MPNTANKKRRKFNSAKILNEGFSIAELIIVIAIFAIVTTIALLDQNRLNSGILITNLGYETALAIREAQVYGVGVRNDGSGAAFNGKYGAYFNMASPEQIVVFADKDSNNDYTQGIGEEQFIYKFTQQRGNKIKAICVSSTENPLFALPCAPGATLRSLRIVFTRPSLEAKFYSIDNNDGPITPVGPAYIVLNNVDNNNCRVVIIEPTGQIRVEKGTNQGGTACANS